jgi:hypothetical protein
MNLTERHNENVLVLLFEIVLINSLLMVQKYHLYEKELSESPDERYLFFIIKLFFRYSYSSHVCFFFVYNFLLV